MFFKWKNLYILAEERLKTQGEYIRELRKNNETYSNIINNINNVLDEHNNHNLNIYFYNDKLYYTVDKWTKSTGDDYVLDLITYKLSSMSSKRVKCIADLNARLEIDYSNNSKTAKLESIDTYSEKRNGHASKLLKRLIYLSEANNVNLIEGNLFSGTPIGIENLKKFYEENGFRTTGSRFKMQIKDPLPKLKL